jgi:hypothetical protein
MQVPTVTSLRLAFNVAVMVVAAVRSTVVWPDSLFCTSNVSPVMVAICPEAEGPNVDAPPAGAAPPFTAAATVVVVVAGGTVVAGALAALGLPPPQAAANKDMRANKPAADARFRVLPEGILICVTGFVPPVSMS